MQQTHGQLIQALDRVEDFLDDNREVMDGALTDEARAFFTANREKMVQYMKAQETYARSTKFGITSKHALRAALVRKHMRPIAAVARLVLPDARELSALTVTSRRRPFVSLVAAGYGMAEAAKVHESALRTAGLAPDFIASLLAATDALRDALSGATQTSGLRVEASAGLRKQGRYVRKVIRALDALVRAAIGEDDVLLERWEHIRRVTSASTSPPPIEPGSGTPVGGTTGVPGGSDAAPAGTSGIPTPLDNAA